jgi:hypothetical protein
MSRKHLTTVDGVIRGLGGVVAAARITGRHPPQICWWRDKRKSIPARFFPSIDRELAERGFRASVDLFDFHNADDVTRISVQWESRAA